MLQLVAVNGHRLERPVCYRRHVASADPAARLADAMRRTFATVAAFTPDPGLAAWWLAAGQVWADFFLTTERRH
ncbi:hypothetical protein [Azospirillum aestuarii]|uniref:hypothetical protein n=1 Tax=Azospirillum aestuarii TaxID=2802052 RepID=UPI0040551396